jgi:hypothetical protein
MVPVDCETPVRPNPAPIRAPVRHVPGEFRTLAIYPQSHGLGPIMA